MRVVEGAQTPAKAMWDFLALSGGEALGKVAGFFAFAILARTLIPEQYGAVELSISVLVLLTSIVEFGFGPIGARDISRDKSQVEALSQLIPMAKLCLVLLCFPVLLAVVYLTNLQADVKLLIVITSLALLTVPLNQRWLLQGHEQMSMISLGQALHMGVFLLGIWLLINAETELYLVGAIEVVASAAMVAYFLYQQHRIGCALKLKFHKESLLKLYTRAFPVGLSKIIWTANQSVPTFMIIWMADAVEVAFYAVAFRVVNALFSFCQIYHFNLYPSVVKRINRSYESFRFLCFPSFRLCAWGGVGVALLGTLLAPKIIVLAFGDQYLKSAFTFSLLIWSVPVMLLSSHARWALIAKDKQRYVMYSQIIGLLVCITACLILVPHFASDGAAVAVLLSGFAVWAYSHMKATEYLGVMPLYMIFKPLLLAAAICAVSFMYADSTLLASLGFFSCYLCAAPLLDKQLIPAIRDIVNSKNEDRAQSEAQPS